MIETIQTSFPKTIGFRLSGRLHDEDYKSFVPTVESFLAAEGKARLFVEFDDFHGWDMRAVWDDTKFAFKHYSDFDRIAMVGDRRWEKWMAQVCKPFTKAKVRYFDASQVEDAWAWLREDVESPIEPTPVP
jgi:hypothetical protein